MEVLTIDTRELKKKFDAFVKAAKELQEFDLESTMKITQE